MPRIATALFALFAVAAAPVLTCAQAPPVAAPEPAAPVIAPHAMVSAANPLAAEAGLKAGDVLVKIGERKVANRFDVERALWNLHPGDTVEARVLRDGQLVQAAMTLGRSAAASDVAAGGITKPSRPTWAVPVQAPAAKDSP